MGDWLADARIFQNPLWNNKIKFDFVKESLLSNNGPRRPVNPLSFIRVRTSFGTDDDLGELNPIIMRIKRAFQSSLIG